MKGIVINIDPTVLTIGHVHINWYSIIIALAIMASIGVAVWEAKRKGLPSQLIPNLAPWVVLGGLIGARLFHVIDHWPYYAANPVQIAAIWQGGLAIWGALAGGATAAVIYSKLKRFPFLQLADVLVPALLVGQIIGRFACIIDGDAVGGVTNLPWGFIYTNPHAMIPGGLYGIPLHPYPVYDQLWNLLGLGLALKLRYRFKINGLLFMSYLSIYAVGRLVFSFVRQENIWFWDLQEAQVIAVAILVIAAGVIIFLSRKSRLALVPKTLG
jgi:phosphatidylglycerol---prolipoprotein diacylglyceryl transferase